MFLFRRGPEQIELGLDALGEMVDVTSEPQVVDCGRPHLWRRLHGLATNSRGETNSTQALIAESSSPRRRASRFGRYLSGSSARTSGAVGSIAREKVDSSAAEKTLKCRSSFSSSEYIASSKAFERARSLTHKVMGEGAFAQWTSVSIFAAMPRGCSISTTGLRPSGLLRHWGGKLAASREQLSTTTAS